MRVFNLRWHIVREMELNGQEVLVENSARVVATPPARNISMAKAILKVTLTNANGLDHLAFLSLSQKKQAASVGDIMLQDGSLIYPTDLTEEQKATAIGVVAYLYKYQTRVGETVRTKLGRNAKDLVLALKNANAGSYVTWRLLCPCFLKIYLLNLLKAKSPQSGSKIF